MIALTVRPPPDCPEGGAHRPATGERSRRSGDAEACGGAPVLDLALCLILAVTVVGLLLLAL